MHLSGSISWFQSKLVHYDASLWDKSIEQRILRELGTKSKTEPISSKDRVDLDLLTGSAYKTKTKKEWTSEVWRGIKTTAFATIYWNYWIRHTSPRIALYIILHFILQFFQVICFLGLDPKTTKVTVSDVLVPLALGLGLGILHAQITAYDPQLQCDSPSRPSRNNIPNDATSDVQSSSPPSQQPPPTDSSLSVVSNLPVDSSPPPAAAVVSSSKPDQVNASNSREVTPKLTKDESSTEEQNERPRHQSSEATKKSDEMSEGNDDSSGDSNSLSKGSEEGRETPNASATLTQHLPVGYRRRAFSLKAVPHPSGCQDPNTDAGNEADEDSERETNESLLLLPPRCTRKRSASLNSDFCPSLVSSTATSETPLVEKIKHFKEAKMRGVTDAEVFADYLGQQGVSTKARKTHVPPRRAERKAAKEEEEEEDYVDDEGDEESGSEEDDDEEEEEEELEGRKELKVPGGRVYTFARSEINGSARENRSRSRDRGGKSVTVPASEDEAPEDAADYTRFKSQVGGDPGSAVVGGGGEAVEEAGEEADYDDDDYEDADGRGVSACDTFTTHRRQRVKFLKLFLERANHHRHQRGGSGCGGVQRYTSALPEEGLIEDTMSLPGSQNASAGGGGGVGADNDLPVVTNTNANSNTSWRSSSAALKRTSTQSARAKLANYRKKVIPLESAAQPASETEYDRMNSDVRSEYDSSSVSDDEQSALRVRAAQLAASAAESSVSKASKGVSAVGKPLSEVPTAQKSGSAHTQLLHVNTEEANESGGGGGGGGGSSGEAVRSNISGSAVGSQNALETVVMKRLTASTTTMTETGLDADEDSGAFALWFFHTIQGFSDPTYAQSETVSCYVWQGQTMKKINCTLLDIGWRIIQSVERQKVSTSYPRLSYAIVAFLSVLPLFFHAWMDWVPPLRSYIGPEPRSHSTTTTTTSPLETPGALLAFCYQWVSDLVTHFHEAKSKGLIDDLAWLASLDNLVIGIEVILRFNIYAAIFFLLCVAERSFQQRLFYAKHFYALTSSHRARRCRIPHLRLNKVGHVKCWLTLRSYLKKRGPQRSVECIVTATFYLAFLFGLGFCYQFLMYSSNKRESVFSSFLAWDILAYTGALSIFLLRFLTLGTKITKKFRNISILITEQFNVFLSLNRKPHKKGELTVTNHVLKMAENLLKEVDGPYRICGWAVNPLIYNVFKLVLLSCFSAFISEVLGFKLKLYKLKLNPANW